ncbi:MAG: DUF983 domain-containing protein [Sphingomonadales bacterium]|nr:DUF983 domain-containing protein [Sphingomonadales bacterium]
MRSLDPARGAIIDLPASIWQAIGRGVRSRCPRCGDAHLFARFLKPMPVCPGCAQDWSPQRADDFPAYISMLVTGHLLAPVVIAIEIAFAPPVAIFAALVIPAAMACMLGLLQPAKGAVIAIQWWSGMHGFRRERRDAIVSASDNVSTGDNVTARNIKE